MIDLQTARGWQVLSGGIDSARENDSDATLLAQGRAGNAAALERLLARHEPGLVRLCKGVLGRKEDAEDAVQESFLRALRGLHRFRGDSSPRTWLYRIAVNVCMEWKRSRWFAHNTLPADIIPSHPSPEAAIVLQDRMAEALSSLLPRHRAAFLLKELHGFSVAEVADAMGWTTTKAQNELYQARKLLLAWRIAADEREAREETPQ